jgi:HlyD family secretion protein
MAAANPIPGVRRRAARLASQLSLVSAVDRDFQPDAIELDTREPPLLARGVLYSLLALIVVAIAWASLSKVDQLVTAHGRLVATAPTIVIQPLETSVIRSIDVRVGQSVKRGDTIATLDPTFTAADVSQLRQRVRSANLEIERLEAELNADSSGSTASGEEAKLQASLLLNRNSEYEARVNAFRADLSRLDADLRGAQRSQEVLRQRLESLKQVEKMKSELKDKQFVSQMNLLESRDKRLEAQHALEEASAKAHQLREQIQQTRHAYEAFTQNWRQKILDDLIKARRERDVLQEQLAKADRRNALVQLTAPMDATVLEISKRSVGSVAKEAEPIVTLVPQGVPVEAEVQIPADDIGFVRKGDPVRVKIDAFPFQKHGIISGTLTAIGDDSFVAEQTASAQRTQTRAYYPARVTGLENTLKKVPQDTRLSPGMTLSAEIRVNERSVISYLLYPLIKAFDESIREP